MPFTFISTEISDVLIVETRAFRDGRGFFMEIYRRSDFDGAGIPEFVQDNYSHSAGGVLRGLHYQKDPFAQGKLVGVISGEIFDVAVDIRAGSPTFGRWVGLNLSADNRRRLYVPPGFAHGFYVLSETADVIYKTTSEYSPDHDRGIAWNDPEIQISWPNSKPDLSEKDSRQPTLAEADNDFVYTS